MNFFSILLCVILLLLSVLHFNWVFGGHFGFDASLPTNEMGEKVLKPKKIDSLIVGLILLLFSVFYLSNLFPKISLLPEGIIYFIKWFVPVIFFLRAIGDFKFVGFFKRIKNTHFGKMDTQYYSPLCILISVFGLIIIYID